MSYFPHFITFLLCSYAVALAILNILTAGKSGASESELGGYAATILSLFQILALAVFMYNQSLWVVESHGESVGAVASVGWLAYDYLNTIFHIAAASSLRYYLTHQK